MKRHQLKSLFRRVPPSFKPHPAILATIFAFTAAFSFMAEIIVGTFSDRIMKPSSTIILLTLMAPLALCGIFPPYFESPFVLLSSIYSSLLGPLAAPTLGIYVLAGAQLVWPWITPGLLLLLVIKISPTAVSLHPSLQAIGAVFGSGVIIVLGLAIRYFRLKAVKTNTQTEHSRRQTERARHEAEPARRGVREANSLVRRQLAVQLHDTIVRDLTYIVIKVQELDQPGYATPEKFAALANQVIVTSKHIEPTILQLDTESRRANITETVSPVTKMLPTRNAILQSDVNENLDPQIAHQQVLLACLVIREAATNVLEYAPTDTTANLEITREPDGAITVATSNAIGDSPANVGTTGGFGPVNLGHQVTLRGDGLEYSHTPVRWVLQATIPAEGRGQLMSEDIRILIADDGPMIHDNFTRLPDSRDNIKIETAAPNGTEALTKITQGIDVALINIGVPILNGIEAAKLIRRSYSQTTIIMLTVLEHEDSLIQVLIAGVQDFLTKNTTPKEIAEYLEEVCVGTTVFDTHPMAVLTKSYTEKTLTQVQYTGFTSVMNTLPQRLQPVFTQLLDTKTNREIAREPHMSPTTVHPCVPEILTHTRRKSRGQLAITAARAGVTQ